MGIEEGKVMGIEEGKIAVATNLKKLGISIDIIISSSGLTKDEIEKL
jgi:predicted transposase/invertase (TIGR01784 family)